MKINLTDIRNMVLESCDMLLLEISNNAIETVIKTFCPDLKDYMNYTLHQLSCIDFMGKLTDTRQVFGVRLCRESFGISNEILDSNPNMKFKDFMRLRIMSEFHINRGNGPIRYIKGIVRICCGEIHMFTEVDYDGLKTFKQIISYLYDNNIDLDENLNGLSLNELNKKFGGEIRKHHISNWLKSNSNNSETQTGDYVVKPIPNYSTAHQYEPYVNWCVTYGENHFNAYTGAGEQFFFCLKKGFEDVPRTEGKNCPLDEYGLSMVSVCIRPDGTPSYITTRWNHDYDGENNPLLKTLEQVEEKLGIPASVFTQNLRPEYEIEDIPYILENSDKPLEEIFTECREFINGMTIVSFHYYDGNYRAKDIAYNVVKDRRLLSNEWFNRINVIDDNYALVRTMNYKYNMLDENGFVFSTMLDLQPHLYDLKLKDVFLIEQRWNEKNLINRNGELLLSEWMQHISEFYGDYAKVYRSNDELNFIDKNFKLVWDEFQDFDIYKPSRGPEWSEGVFIVTNGKKQYTYVSILTGKSLMRGNPDKWFDGCDSFLLGMGKVMRYYDGEKMYNMVNLNGELVSDMWFQDITATHNNNCVVTNAEGLQNILTSNKKLFFKTWKKEIPFYDGVYGCVQDTDEQYIVFKDKKVLFKTSYKLFMHFPNNTFAGCGFKGYDIFFNFVDEKGNDIIPGGLKMGKAGVYTDTNGNEYNVDFKTGDLTRLNKMNA